MAVGGLTASLFGVANSIIVAGAMLLLFTAAFIVPFARMVQPEVADEA